jgi:C1A family cysteine protease
MKMILLQVLLKLIGILFFLFSKTTKYLHKAKLSLVAYIKHKEQSSAGKKYGWIPDTPDSRDFKFALLNKVTKKLPTKIDLREFCSPVEDQGSLGSCTANALVGALEFLLKKNKKSYEDFSRLFIYYNERVLEGTVMSDSGAMIRDGIKTLNKNGACSEKLWPYVISKFKKKPTCKCYSDAKNHQILEYQRINNKNLNEIKSALALGFPVIFGFAVFDSFETEEVSRTGDAPMPSANDTMLGGHAVLAVGFDDKTQRFLIKNSWGTGWGNKGYFTLPYAYLTDTDLAEDFWYIKTAENM